MEEDITNRSVNLLAPADGATVSTNVVHFEWSEMDGADDYRLQIIDETQSTVLDTLISERLFAYAMQPGHYQWRVRGENFAYTSSYSYTSEFDVVRTDDLSSQQVVQTAPAAGLFTKNTSLTLLWDSVFAADSYDLTIYNLTTGSVSQQTGITSTTFTLSGTALESEGEFQWKVRAKNSANGTETAYSTRNFFIDRTAPQAPSYNTPAANATVSSGTAVNFTWSTVTHGDNESPISYTLEISESNTFTSVLQTYNVAVNSQSHTFSTSGDFYWRLRSKDAAGNIGSYGPAYKVTVTQ
ncbi:MULTISPECIES: hypothetical protein [unclassified Flavobacterium]|uniref:hypothetical protein n=1 Tax=unclassified Flavobacterium TaxID=196869 RepID=UPI001F13786B|nr:MULTISPECIES: hypothetical protein [unclassified Flavobacterium]UMY66264.1 hypothetical protein MKO97_02470 [Flavobacterium sp. HJ-32-4]